MKKIALLFFLLFSVASLKAQEYTSLEDALKEPEKVKNLAINTWVSKKPKLDSIPAAIGKLKNLRVLFLTDQNLSTLPKEVAQLTQLEELSLAGNQFKTLPDCVYELAKLKKLKELILFDNPLTKEEIKKIKQSFKNVKVLLDEE